MSTAPSPGRQRKNILHTLLTCAALVCLPGAAIASGPMTVGDGLVLSCSRPESSMLRCDYRLTGSGHPLATSATIGDISLADPTFAARTGAPDNTAILLLVDTSDPARAPAIVKAREHIARLVNEADPHLRFGLASFDSDLEMLVPIGSDIDSIVAATQSLRAKGPTTELYRNIIGALDLLSTATDEHKVLMVLSDGLAEDRAYFHADAVRTALNNHIAIYSIGYPRSVALSVGLQSLRRLADETGGQYIAADNALNLPDDYFGAPFTTIENVGALSVDLRGAADALSGGTHGLNVVLETDGGPTSATIPVTLPARLAAEPVVKVVEIEVPRIIEVEKIVRVSPRVTAPPGATGPGSAAADQSAGIPLWYWVIAIALLALALLVLLLVLLMQRRSNIPQSPPDKATPAPVSIDGLAYLTLIQDEDRLPYPITSTTFRIGRLTDNDLVIRDPSVSRHHAEIRRRRDGGFKVLDLDSMNGVFVNGSKVRESDLTQGDKLDVGDVRMLFSAENVDELTGENTVMLRTVLPDQPFPGAAKAASR